MTSARGGGLQDLTRILSHEAMAPKLCGLRQWERLHGEESADPPRAGKFRMSPLFPYSENKLGEDTVGIENILALSMDFECNRSVTGEWHGSFE